MSQQTDRFWTVDFFVAVGSWLASVDMTVPDTLTAIAAVGALAMSGASLRQSAKQRPQPHFWIEWEKHAFEFNGVLVVVCRFGNDGTDAARNLRVTVKGPGIVCKLKHWDQFDKFPDGERLGFEVPLEPAIRDWAPHGSPADRGRELLPAGSAQKPTPLGALPLRDEYLRPVVKLKYRGRWRAVRSRAPKATTLEFIGRSAAC